MLFFKGKEDMGLEASLKLLDLPSDATIDDANQAYSYLHQMIDLFHQDADAGDRGDRNEDMDLLSCAYEKAVAYLSDRNPPHAPSVPPRSSSIDGPRSTDLHFTINVSADADPDESLDDIGALPVANARTVEDAISITSRRMQQAESALPAARQAVDSAMAAAEAANRRHERARQARLTAVIAAKSAKNRALLLEIEAKRAIQEAIAVAEKARDRVVAARQAASDATAEGENAREQANRVKKSEETAAAEAVCAEDRLEKEKARLKALTHTLVEARSRMRMFQGTAGEIGKRDPQASIDSPVVMSPKGFSASQAAGGDATSRQQIMSDLLEIEAALNARKENSMPADANGAPVSDAAGRTGERRRHHRVIYPLGQCPLLSIDGREIPIIDLSTAGMRLKPDAAVACSRLVRGVIAFSGRAPVQVTGKVVRKDDAGLGLKLVTRIGDHILNQERLRLSA
ncbi:PilZ domain-containing protein [uncultured Desulfosarcina sp.]|uniref:PilZ domain-containing protein n=1 Tax=uncultured Desulfosarcina sp. TaxID=218289 RepID=UPI0029C99DF3|nr:PilZ domain-containing protein [uncultured Desulfosarcina sp.]